jgi:hypothetical protein
MKKMIFSACILCTAFGANAQKANLPRGVKFSVGAELGGATGNLNSFYSLVAGGTAQLDFKIDNDASLTLNTGVIDFVGKKISNTNLKYQSAAAIPLLGGVKYYFTPKVYGSAQLGGTFFLNNGGGSAFTYAPGIGVKIDESLDLLLKYTGYSSMGGAFGIRLGYTFK